MKKLLRLFMIFLVLVGMIAFLFYLVGFTLQLMGLGEAVSGAELRGALSGTAGSSGAPCNGSLIWQMAAVLGTYAVPLVLVVLAVNHLRKRVRK